MQTMEIIRAINLNWVQHHMFTLVLSMGS